jgi:hypothetical protein
MHPYSQPCLVSLCATLLLAPLPAAAQATVHPPPPAEQEPGERLVLPGLVYHADALGFGWSRREMSPNGVRFAWIQHLEADVHLELPDPPADATFELRAKPLYLAYRRQVIALYVNHRFVTEWACADSPHFDDFTARIPARYFRTGPNTLTLRMAYRKSGGDRRKLSLGVASMRLRFD